MMDMLSDCSIFLHVDKNTGNYYQLSGIPMSELKFEQIPKNKSATTGPEQAMTEMLKHEKSQDRSPGSITLIRSRIFYAKAALNAEGGVRFGMRHIR